MCIISIFSDLSEYITRLVTCGFLFGIDLQDVEKKDNDNICNYTKLHIHASLCFLELRTTRNIAMISAFCVDARKTQGFRGIF